MGSFADDFIARDALDAVHKQAFALVAAAADPAGCADRLKLLQEATTRHDEARDAAETRKQAALDLEGKALDKLAELKQQREEHETRVTGAEYNLKQREVALAENEARLAEKTHQLALLEETLRKGENRLDQAIRVMRQYLDGIAPAKCA
jgi:hypothetical protein